MIESARRSVAHPPAPVVLAASYLAGSVSFSQLASRRTRGVDLREVGTGTVSGTSLYAVAGFKPLAVAGVLDVAKGALGPLLAGRGRPELAGLAAGATVVAHNWSPWLGGAGGRGISPAIGALLVVRWPAAALLLGGLAGGRLARQTALVSFFAELGVVALLSADGGDGGAVAGIAIVAPMLAKRVLGNGPPRRSPAQVRLARLLFDRDDWRAEPDRDDWRAEQ
jgi:glycerol-3-phosphate acyltransferase PlsY